MNTKFAVPILICLTLLTFGNSLMNGFVGDDEVHLINNDFYKSLKHLPHLFSDSYITSSQDLFTGQDHFSSGEVSYRPVFSLTLFLDYFIWKLNPFGYHLTNVLLHLFNTLLVFFLLQKILKESAASFLSAALFCVHPVVNEAVNAINFRHELLAAFFLLLSLLFYMRSQESPTKQKDSFILSNIFYGLSLFSKEYGVVFVLILILYDTTVKRISFHQLIKEFSKRHLSYILICLFYLYVYLFVFPNSAVNANPLMGGTVEKHILSVVFILSSYIKQLFNPLAVQIYPPLFRPYMSELGLTKQWLDIIILLLCFASLLVSKKRSNTIFFCGLWFVVFLIPVSNIVPLANPVALRFLYLPSVGFMVLLASLLLALQDFLKKQQKLRQLGIVLIYIFVILCINLTIILNMTWKSNSTLAQSWIRHFPEHNKGYSILGIEAFRNHECDMAKAYLKKHLQYKGHDPRSYYMIAACSLDNFSQAEIYFLKAISYAPNYREPHYGLGLAYYLKKEYAKAVPYLEKSNRLKPTFHAYKFLLLAYQNLGDQENFDAALRKAQQSSLTQVEVQKLKDLKNQTP